MKESRQIILADLVRAHGWTMGAEIGVWQGATFGYLLERCPKLYLIGVDNWRGDGVYQGKDMRHAEDQVAAIVRRFGNRCHILKEDSERAAALVTKQSLDFVFIDADHDTPHVLADIRAWRPKLKSGGRMLGHDCNLKSVRAALDQEKIRWWHLGANVWTAPAEA